MFKFAIVFSTLFFVLIKQCIYALDDEQAVIQCLTDHKINQETREFFKSVGELPEGADHTAKCVFLCASKKLGWTDDSGIIDQDKIVQFITTKYTQLDKEQFSSVVSRCASDRKETDNCDKWYEFTKCKLKAYLSPK